jgi:hypothetical protein
VKFLCPACERLLDLERFSLEGAALVVTCQRCGASSRATAATGGAQARPSPPRHQGPPSPRVALMSSPHASNVVTLKTVGSEAVQLAARAASQPLEVPAGLCPKCLGPRGEGAACPACGLSFEAYRPGSLDPPVWLKTGWVELLRDWGNDARHERLRAEASGRRTLPELGRLYRLRLASVPDDPWANAGCEEVQRLAQAAVAANLSAPRETPPGRGSLWLKVLLGGGLLAAAAAVLRLLLAPRV